MSEALKLAEEAAKSDDDKTIAEHALAERSPMCRPPMSTLMRVSQA